MHACVYTHIHVHTCEHTRACKHTHDYAHIHIGHTLRKYPFDLEQSSQVCVVSQLSLMALLSRGTLCSYSPELRNIAEDLIQMCPMSVFHTVMVSFSCQLDTIWNHL